MNYDTSLKAKNRGVRRQDPEFIVIHDTAGSGGHGDARYLANDPEGRGISVDFCIIKDGTVYQLNADLKGHYTFHAGRKTRYEMNGKKFINGAVNQHSIGIEIAQKANMAHLVPLYPDIQVQEAAKLCKALCREFHIETRHITTHSKIITDGSRSDPRKFPWDAFWTYFDETPDASQNHMTETLSHTVRAGDTLWSLANRYHTTVERLKALNGMDTPETIITVGQVLQVK